MHVRSRTTPRARDPESERVLSAAREMLAEERANATLSLDTVAARAGVARAQIQRQFATLAGVLEALWDRLVSEGCLVELPRAFAQADAGAALNELIAIHAGFWDAQRRVVRRLLAFAALEFELERALQVRERDRREALRKLAARIAPHASKPELTELTGALALVTAFPTFDAIAGPERRIAEVVPEVHALARAALARWTR